VAAGGLYSNAADMAGFLLYQLADCRMNGKMTISPELLTQMHTVQFKLAGQQAGYGLGVMIKPFHGATLLYHPGGGYGYSAALAFIPEARIGIVILTNSAEGYTFNQQILKKALEAMLTLKTGVLKPESKLTALPAVRLDKFSLNTLTGTNKTNRKLVEIRQAAGKLVLVSGSDTSYFTANSRVKFSDLRGNQLIFHLDKKGMPVYFINVNEHDADVYFLNDTPSEKAGPDKASWKALTGTYKGSCDRQPETIRLFIKNGYLYSSAGGATRVSEYLHGIYFTADGESLFKRNGILYLGNRAYQKQ